MKKAFQIPGLAIAVLISVAGCAGNNSGNAADSGKSGSSSVVKKDTTVSVDVSKKTDTVKMNNDTVSSSSKTKIVKKEVVKKNN